MNISEWIYISAEGENYCNHRHDTAEFIRYLLTFQRTFFSPYPW